MASQFGGIEVQPDPTSGRSQFGGEPVDPRDVTIAPDPAAVAALERGPGIPLYQVAPGRPQKELPPIGAKGKDLGRFSGDYSLGQNVQSGYQSGLAGVDRLIANISGLAEASATDYPMLSLGGAEIYKHIGNWARDQQKYREEKAAEYAGGRQDLPSKVIRGATSAVTSLPITAAATTLGGPVLGMAGLGALETADQGDWNMLKGAAEGAAMGKFMHVLSPAGRVLRVPIVAAAEYAKNVAQGVDHETALANALNMAGLSAVGGPGEVSARDLPAHMLESLKPSLAVKSTLNPVEQSAIDYLREKNVPLTPGTITGNRYLRANEAVVKTSPLGQQTAADFNRGTTEGIQRVAGELSNQVYPQPVTPESAGEAVTGKLQKNIKDLGLTEDEAYQDAWTGRGEDKYTENVPVRMRKVAETDDAGKPTGRMIDQPVMAKVNMPVDMRDLKAQAEPLFEEMQWMPASDRASSAGYAALAKILNGDDFIPAWAAEKGLSGLKTMARVTSKSGVRNTGQGVAASLISDLQGKIDATVAKTGGAAIQGLMRGRATHANLMDVADLADQLRTEPVQTFNQMVWQHDTGIAFLRKIEEQAPEQIPLIARAWVQQQFEKASEEGGFTKTGGILKQWRNLGPETQKIFFPDRAVRESLGHLFKGADMVQFNPNTSGTELLRQATSTNPLRWVAGYLGSKLFYTPTGIELLTEKLRPRMGPPPAPATVAPTGGGPPPTPPGEGTPPAGQGGGIRQKLMEGLKRVVGEEEGSLKLRQGGTPQDDYSKHLPPPKDEPVSPYKVLRPLEDRSSGKLEGSLHDLRRSVERDPSIGSPDNQRTVLRDSQGSFVIGKLTPKDWINRVDENLSADDMVNARKWYRELKGFFDEHFGEKEGSKMALAWLSSQQNVSPSGGMMNVLRAMDQLRGMPRDKVAGLAEAKILAALKGEVPEGGYGAKLNDFVDSALGKTTRTWMGDDPRGGQPAVIDVWANRDVGKVDQKLLDYLTERFGPDAVKKLKMDGTSIGETDYEYGSKFYNDLVNHLNKVGYDGGGWTGDQVQAVGWTAMQKAMGAEPEFASDLVTKNTRRYGFEVQPGQGAPVLKQYPWDKLSIGQQTDITKYIGEKVTDLAAQMTGAKITGREVTRGGYLGQPTVSIQMDTFASPETFEDFGRAAGYLGQQSEVWHIRPLKSGDTWSYYIRGDKLNTPEIQQEFWQRLAKVVGPNLVPGYSPMEADIGPGVFIVNPFTKKYLVERQKAGFKWDPSLRYWTAKDKAKIEAGINTVEKEMGLSLTIDLDKVDLGASLHNWANTRKKTNGHLQRLIETGRSDLAEKLSNHAPEALQSWWKEAWDKYAGTGAGGESPPSRSK